MQLRSPRPFADGSVLDEKSMHDISRRHGCSGADVSRKACTRRFGVNPTEYALASRRTNGADPQEASP
jgi:hypothetical protein